VPDTESDVFSGVDDSSNTHLAEVCDFKAEDTVARGSSVNALGENVHVDFS